MDAPVVAKFTYSHKSQKMTCSDEQREITLETMDHFWNLSKTFWVLIILSKFLNFHLKLLGVRDHTLQIMAKIHKQRALTPEGIF